MIKQTYLKANNGIEIPNIAFGTGRLNDDNLVSETLKKAVKAGYKHFDFATDYENLSGVVDGIKYCLRNKFIQRPNLFLTLKISNHGYDSTIKIVENFLEDLDTKYIDMVLIHYPWDYDKNWKLYIIDTYRALEYLYKQGKIRVIGVSNFEQEHLIHLLNYAIIKPAVNQIEVHPRRQQEELVEFCKSNNIIVEAYSPIMYVKDINLLRELGERYNKSFAQIALKWCIQSGFIPICSSKIEEQLIENINIYDFELQESDMNYIKTLDSCMYKYDMAAHHYANNAEKFLTYKKFYKLFGFLPLLKEIRESRRIAKLYFLGIPIMKIDKKINYD